MKHGPTFQETDLQTLKSEGRHRFCSLEREARGKETSNDVQEDRQEKDGHTHVYIHIY